MWMNGPRNPGQSTRRSASRHTRASDYWAAFAAVLVLCAVEGLGKLEIGASLLCVALAAYCVRKSRERSHMAGAFELGAESEVRVGALLAEVQNWGWALQRDVLKGRRGNIDHVALSDSTIFTIDTKRSTWRERDLDQAHRHAEWAAAHYRGQRPIVPVICVQRSGQLAEEVDGVVVVGSARLLDFLRSQRWPTYDAEIFGYEPAPYPEPIDTVWTDSLAQHAIDAEDDLLDLRAEERAFSIR